jgi:hypothetical protein
MISGEQRSIQPGNRAVHLTLPYYRKGRVRGSVTQSSHLVWLSRQHEPIQASNNSE